MTDDEQVADVERTVKAIKPMLAGKGPNVQSAILADLLALHIAGHAPSIRDAVLAIHLELVEHLVKINEAMLFGGRGHPGG